MAGDNRASLRLDKAHLNRRSARRSRAIFFFL